MSLGSEGPAEIVTDPGVASLNPSLVIDLLWILIMTCVAGGQEVVGLTPTRLTAFFRGD